MPLLELPVEVQLLIYEHLPGIQALHTLTRTSSKARVIYKQHHLSILANVLFNSYPDLSRVIVNAVRARCSSGNLRYALAGDEDIIWSTSGADLSWSSAGSTDAIAISVLKATADVVYEAEELALHLKHNAKSQWAQRVDH